jgi:MSHA pilin protein MshD
MCIDRRRAVRGFSLIEMIVFIVIVGVSLAGVLSVLDLTVSRSADPMLAKQALAVGEAFIDEILSREYLNPGAHPAPTDPRTGFVYVDDYNGYPTPAALGIRTRANVPNALIPGLEQYRVAVSVALTTAAIGPVGNQVPAGQMQVITVTVTDPAGRIYPMTAYRANYKAN